MKELLDVAVEIEKLLFINGDIITQSVAKTTSLEL